MLYHSGIFLRIYIYSEAIPRCQKFSTELVAYVKIPRKNKDPSKTRLLTDMIGKDTNLNINMNPSPRITRSASPTGDLPADRTYDQPSQSGATNTLMKAAPNKTINQPETIYNESNEDYANPSHTTDN